MHIKTVKDSSKFLTYFEKYMMVVGTLGQMLYYVQAIKIFATRSAHDVSIIGFLLGFTSVTSWLIYGILIKNKVVAITNIVGVIGTIFAILGILMYGK